jgi:hypothetical protein
MEEIEAADPGRRRDLTTDQRRRDLALTALVADAFPVDPSRTESIADQVDLIAAAAKDRNGPRLLRGLHRTPGFRNTIAKILEEHSQVLDAGAPGLATLLASPPREIQLGGKTRVAHVGVAMRSGSQTGTLIIVRASLTEAGSGDILNSGINVDECHLADETRAFELLTDLAVESGYRPWNACLRVVVLLGPTAAALFGKEEWLAGRLAVEACDAKILSIYDNRREAARDEKAAVAGTDREVPLLVLSVPGERLLWKIAADEEKRPRTVIRIRVGGTREIATSEIIAAIRRPPRSKPNPDSEVPSERRVNKKRILSKEGNRGDHDHLVVTERDCTGRKGHGKRANARGADKKWRGAQLVEELPPGTELVALEMCKGSGCNLSCATYSLPVELAGRLPGRDPDRWR